MTSLLRHRRVRAALIHASGSALLALIVSFVVFRLWYPPPYATFAGGLSLFGILISVDLVLGPLLTFVIAAEGKPRKELTIDLSLIVLVQLAGMAYGLHTIAIARPVLISYEIDRFRVVSATDIDPTTLHEAPPGMREFSWTGPKLIAAPKPTDPQEQLRSIDLGLNGIDLSMVPKYWAPFAPHAAEAWAHARPLALLRQRYPQSQDQLSDIAATAGIPVDNLRFLPLLSRRASWVAIVAQPDTRIVGYLPLDGFF